MTIGAFKLTQFFVGLNLLGLVSSHEILSPPSKVSLKPILFFHKYKHKGTKKARLASGSGGLERP